MIRVDTKVGIIGGGLAGLSCARVLADAGVPVQVFDKGRLPGGRTATRRPGRFIFAHGAAAFDDGVQPPVHGDPRSRALELADGLDVRHARVSRVIHEAAGWRLLDDGGTVARGLSALVATCPAPEAKALLVGEPIAASLEDVRYDPCWSIFVATAAPVTLDAMSQARTGPIQAVAQAAAAPDDPVRALALFQAGAAYMVHTTPAFSAAHLDDDADEVTATVIDAFVAATGAEVVWRDAHRWRWARVTKALGEPYLFDAERRLGIAGDLCLGGGVSNAVTSGRALAARLVEELGARAAPSADVGAEQSDSPR